MKYLITDVNDYTGGIDSCDAFIAELTDEEVNSLRSRLKKGRNYSVVIEPIDYDIHTFETTQRRLGMRVRSV